MFQTCSSSEFHQYQPFPFFKDYFYNKPVKKLEAVVLHPHLHMNRKDNSLIQTAEEIVCHISQVQELALEKSGDASLPQFLIQTAEKIVRQKPALKKSGDVSVAYFSLKGDSTVHIVVEIVRQTALVQKLALKKLGDKSEYCFEGYLMVGTSDLAMCQAILM